MTEGTALVTLADRGPAAGDAVRALLEPDKAAIIAKLAELAKMGDPRSIELALKYLAPQPKLDAERITVPGLRDAPTAREKSLCILDAVANGTISVEAAERLQRMLQLHTQALTLTDVAADVAVLKAGRRPPKLPLVQRVDTFDDLA